MLAFRFIAIGLRVRSCCYYDILGGLQQVQLILKIKCPEKLPFGILHALHHKIKLEWQVHHF